MIIIFFFKVKEWNNLKEINLQLFFAALFHVVWLSVDMLSFKKILPVVAERLCRDIPCWIFVSVMFYYLSMWYNANNAITLGGKESALFNRRNVYLFQVFTILVDISLRVTQQVYNDPALFSFFEGIYMILLSLVSLLFVILCHFLLYQSRIIVIESHIRKSSNDKIARFYELMKKFYFLMAPGGLVFVILGFCLVGTRIIYLPVVIAAEHLWTIALHFFSWASLNLILWKFSFAKKRGKKTSDTKNTTDELSTTNKIKSQVESQVANTDSFDPETKPATSPINPENLQITFSHEPGDD